MLNINFTVHKIKIEIKLLNKGALVGIYKYYNMVKDIELIAKEDFEVFWWKYRTSAKDVLWALFERSEFANYL